MAGLRLPPLPRNSEGRRQDDQNHLPSCRPSGASDSRHRQGPSARDTEEERAQFSQLMGAHHYLKSNQLVGEQLRYVAEVDGRWVAFLSWSAASYHLKNREKWIHWSEVQHRRRLTLVANNSRFLILPEVDCPHLASRVLALCLTRFSADWEAAYHHPILLVIIPESSQAAQLHPPSHDCYQV